MATSLNLVRNSRLFFTTNVDSSTGKINTSGFSATNTQEIQVLDNFTFSQNTNADVITISEAGSNPVRGQRSFNTSLAPVDFSFSTYVRPYKDSVSSTITAEESGLWNALLGAVTITDGTSTITGITGVEYTASTGVITITGSNMTYTGLVTDDITTLTGLTTTTASDAIYVNAPGKITNLSTTSITVQMINPKPGLGSISIGAFTGTMTVYESAWAPISNKLSQVTSANSNKNQLLKFGMIFIVDSVTYALDNCAMNQVTLDFGLDAIATLAWTGQATVLRDVTNTGGLLISVSGNESTITGITSTENIFVGQTVVSTSTDGSTVGTSATVKSIGTNSLVVTGTSPVQAAVTTPTLSSLKVTKALGSATLSSYSGTGPWTMTLTNLTTVDGLSIGDTIAATAGGSGATAGNFGANNTVTVKSIENSASIIVTITGSTTPTSGTSNGGNGLVTAVTATIATVGFTSGLTGLAYKAKNDKAPFITNKLSTVNFKTLNSLGSAAPTTYSIALTGGSLTINNNITYITPANLGIVNVPAVYYTGTRSITGTMNAYLKTGTGAGSTGQLLQDMLNAATASIEPMAALTISVGGSADTVNRVVLDMPAVTFSIPTIDVQQIVSTAINFTAEGSAPSAGTNLFDITATNDLTVRYYGV
jgi:hypothetical protein